MADANPQQQISFLRNLRAVRRFRPDPLPQEAIDAILAVARWSGSASNNQPWELVLIQKPETLQAMAQAEGYAGHLAGAQAGLLLVMFGNSDHISTEAFDEGRLSERIMLAASAYGIGSCIGWFIGSGPAAIKSLLGIPQERLVRTVISLGYPDEEAQRQRAKPAQARKSLSTIVHQERYSS